MKLTLTAGIIINPFSSLIPSISPMGFPKSMDKNRLVFVQQAGAINSFRNSDSWVILSPTEQCIKQKIEAIGTPLKDWDIKINYGIKTGFNDSFIISTEKRNEILAECQTVDEQNKTAELIRPFSYVNYCSVFDIRISRSFIYSINLLYIIYDISIILYTFVLKYQLL